jgi:hypothetical protein
MTGLYPICTSGRSGNHMNLCLGVPTPLTHAGLRRAADGTRTHDLLHGKEQFKHPEPRTDKPSKRFRGQSNPNDSYARDTASCTPCVPRGEVRPARGGGEAPQEVRGAATRAIRKARRAVAAIKRKRRT